MSTTTDNTVLNPGASGDIIRDVIKESGAKTQIVGLDLGGAGKENLLNQSNPMPTNDQLLLEALDHESNNIEQRALTDILSKYADNFEPIPVELTGPGGVPYKQDPDSGGMVVNVTNNSFDFRIGVATGITPPIPCKNKAGIYATLYHPTSSFTAVLEGYFIGAGWVILYTSASVNGGTPNYSAGSIAAGPGATFINAALCGADLVRIRFTSLPIINPPALITGIISSTPPGIANSNVTAVQSGTWNIAQFSSSAINMAALTSVLNSGTAALSVSSFSGSFSSASDSPGGAKTTSTNTGTISDVEGGAISAAIVITPVSGTNPTLDLVLKESPDGGTTWIDVWHCERATAATTLIVPNVPINGRRRWDWTVGGTTPSFTFSIGPTRGSTATYPRIVQFFDRTAGLLSGTLNATSSAYVVSGCSKITASVTIGAATTGGTYKLQLSADGTNFYDASAAVVAVANSTVVIPNTLNVVGKFARVICSSAATAQTGTHVAICGNQ